MEDSWLLMQNTATEGNEENPKQSPFKDGDHGQSNNTSKLKIFNKNCKGLGTTEKEKKQEETQTGR